MATAEISQFVYATGGGKCNTPTVRATQLAVRLSSLLNGHNELFSS